MDTAGAKPGMRFLVHGASGGVGSLAAQLARKVMMALEQAREALELNQRGRSQGKIVLEVR